MGESNITCSWDTIEELSTPDCMVLGGGSSPCEIRISSQDPIGRLHLVSNAKTCELRNQGAYVGTIKASDEEAAGHFSLKIDIEGLCTDLVMELVLRMLSLSEKGIFRLHSLEVVPADGKEKEISNHASSQMDAIKNMLQASSTEQPADPKQKFMAAIARAALSGAGNRAFGEKQSHAQRLNSQVASFASNPSRLEQGQPDDKLISSANLETSVHNAASEPGRCEGEEGQRPSGFQNLGSDKPSVNFLQLQRSLDAILQSALSDFEQKLELVVDKQIQRFQQKLNVISETGPLPYNDQDLA